mmetsp:Transcript_112741/g.299519  ORF Transcript_112741/g.299519 Transcript_112741/m.299519 type:complete len:239 (-) Transcript_112741:54-770(-)
MAISLAESRLAPLSTRVRGYLPFGPFGMPPSVEELPEEYDDDGHVLQGRNLRRSYSWSGFSPYIVPVMATPSPRVKQASVPQLEEDTNANEEHEETDAPPEQDIPAISTYMVKNLGTTLSRRAFTRELDRMGFPELYDFVHIPANFGTGKTKGFAFVNFVTFAAAAAFKRRFPDNGDAQEGPPTWVVTPADVQGLEANIAAAEAKWRRIRNNAYRPLVLVRGVVVTPPHARADAAREG